LTPLMSTASKPSGEQFSAPAREYKTHFELWDEANAIHDADAPPVQNGHLRPWTKPVLTTKPVSLPPRKKTAPPVEVVASPWAGIPIAATYVGAIAIGIFFAVLLMRPWEYSTAPPSSKPLPRATAKPVPHAKPAPKKPLPKVALAAPGPEPKLTAAPKILAIPKAAPSVATAAKPAVVVSAKKPVASASVASRSHVAATLVKPVVQPSSAAIAAPKMAAAAPSPAIISLPPPAPRAPAQATKPEAQPAPPSASARVASVPVPIQHPAIEPSPAQPPTEEIERSHRDNKVAAELAPLHTMLLESTIRTQLAAAGFPDLGVSMTEEGDVYLNGTFLNMADQDKAIAMIREHRGVRDIYFSGSVWHDVNSQHEQEASPTVTSVPNNAVPKADGVRASAPEQQANISAPESKPLPARHVKIAHSVEFPVTAAEAPAPLPRYAAPVQPSVVPTPEPKPQGLFPFRWFNKLTS
jgi:hypothetical protein